jgi:hypothetical protein
VGGFLGCLIHRIALASHLILYESKKMVVQGGLVWSARMLMRQKFPPLLLNPLLAQMSTEESCVVMLQDGHFLPWMFVTQCTMKLLAHL